MGEQTKNLLIGLFVLAACALAIFFVMFLKPSVGDMKQTLYVRFSDINKIGIGTRVMFDGKPVGEVVNIAEIPDARSQPTDVLGRVYFYQLTLHVDSNVKVYDTDQVSSQTSGLLGEKSVSIVAKAPPKGVTPKLITTQPIYADSVDPIEYALHEISALASNMETTVKDINTWFSENSDQIAATIRNIGDTMCEIQVAVKTINQENLIQEVKKGAEYFTCMMKGAQDAITQMTNDEVFTNIGTTVCNFKNASHSVDLFTQDIADGCGTIGKLIKNDDFYLRVNALMSKADTMMNDINHYGLLFHLNKSWQRTRTKRMTLMESLNTPTSFTNYFESEIDQINTSMARISELVHKAQESPEKETIMHSTPFKEDFAELLREVDELSNNLKLYNEELHGTIEESKGCN